LSRSAIGDDGFTVTATGDNGATASVQGDLKLAGQPAPPDPHSHGIVAALASTEATAGQGGSGRYELQLTSTGSAVDTFAAGITGLPAGVTASFSQTSAQVPPGVSIFRDVALSLAVSRGTAPGRYPFSVTVSSTGDPSVSATVQVRSLSDAAIAMTAVASVATVATAQTQPTPTSTDSPKVTPVLRFGYHAMPTTVAVTFNQALDSARAEDVRDYRIIGPAVRVIRVKKAVYVPATNTVRLRTARRINIHYKYELILDGQASTA
jgi:hypothetical protein